MKKLIILIISLFIFIPLGVNADSPYYTGQFTWKFSNGNNLPAISNTTYQHYENTPNNNFMSYTYYLQNVGLGSFDYTIISTYISSNSISWWTGPNCSQGTGTTCTFNQENAYNLSIIYTRTNNAQYEAPCYILSQSGESQQYATWLCPIGITAKTFDGIRFNIHTNYPTNAIDMAINKWITFHYIDTSTTDITNAITNQNTAINNTTNAVNGLNDSLTDDSGNSDSDNDSAIQGFESKLGTNDTITSLITMPITLFQSVLNSISGSCTPFTLGSLLGTNVTFPCINPANYLGNDLWHIIDVIASGFFIFYMSKRFINIFENFTSMKDGKDEVGD